MCFDRTKKVLRKIGILILITVSVVVLFLGAIFISDQIKYLKAKSFMKREQYQEAYVLFDELCHYKDSKKYAKKARMKKNEQKLKNCKVGDYITWGREIIWDSNACEICFTDIKEIEWLVLDKKEDKILVISRYGLANKCYNTKDEYASLIGAYDAVENTLVTWENSTIRQMLNHRFLLDNFNDEEKERIVETSVLSDESSSRYDTIDKIFLLSSEEFERYSNSKLKKCELADGVLDSVGDNEQYYWWLRSPGANQGVMECVDKNGELSKNGKKVGESNIVRPCMWINIK